MSAQRPPRILFLPGVGGDGRFWKPVADRLPTDREKILLDWPGLGAVPRSAGVNSVADLVSLAAARLDGPTDVVAQSMGGSIAVGLALRNPSAIRRLVLCASSAGIDPEDFDPKEWRTEYRRNYPDAVPWIAEPGAAQVDPARLRDIDVPVLLLWGDADPITPLALGRHLAGLLPSAELVVFAGGDHSLAYKRAEEVAPHVARHLGLA